MRIQITQIHPSLVDFKTPYGIGRAVWADKKPLRLLVQYDVEFTIPEVLLWGQTIFSCHKDIPVISYTSMDWMSADVWKHWMRMVQLVFALVLPISLLKFRTC